MGAMRRRVGAVVLLALAVLGFLLSRAGRVDQEFAKMNPIRDKAVLAEVAAAPEDADPRFLTVGSALAAETLYLPPLPVLRCLSLGVPTALADLLFIRAHAYFLSHFFADRMFRWLDHYVDAVLGLDPDNPRVYLWAAQAVKLGQDVNDDVIRHSNRFLEAGVARFPRDFRLHTDLGFNLYFEFKGKDEQERARARMAGRDHFVIAASLPGSQIDPNFVHEMFRREGAEGLGVAIALQKYYEAPEDQREQLRRRIREISVKLEQDVREEEEVWKRDYAYLPGALFSLIGVHPQELVPREVLKVFADQ